MSEEDRQFLIQRFGVNGPTLWEISHITRQEPNRFKREVLRWWLMLSRGIV